MGRVNLTAKVLGRDEWPDSREQQRSYWLSRPAAERVAAGRQLHKNVCRWFHLVGTSAIAAVGRAQPRE